MKIYLDTSVINVYLFGKFSEVEKERLPGVDKLFGLINTGDVSAIVSLYSIQEIYAFCGKTFSRDEAGHIARLALSDLFANRFELAGLLSREERLLHRNRFIMSDLSDQPHAISAFINKCDAIITFDRHFRQNADLMPPFTPEEFIQFLSSVPKPSK